MQIETGQWQRDVVLNATEGFTHLGGGRPPGEGRMGVGVPVVVGEGVEWNEIEVEWGGIWGLSGS